VKRGLPYGWWKDPDTWAGAVLLLTVIGLGIVLFGAWFLAWQLDDLPWWN
jgi:hypothetical protein